MREDHPGGVMLTCPWGTCPSEAARQGAFGADADHAHTLLADLLAERRARILDHLAEHPDPDDIQRELDHLDHQIATLGQQPNRN